MMTKTTFYKQKWIGIVLGCLLVFGCTTLKEVTKTEESSEQNYPLTEDEKRLREQAKKFDKTVWEEISDGSETITVGSFDMPSRAYVSRFNFRGSDQQMLVKNLSGGGKTFLAWRTCPERRSS